MNKTKIKTKVSQEKNERMKKSVTVACGKIFHNKFFIFNSSPGLKRTINYLTKTTCGLSEILTGPNLLHFISVRTEFFHPTVKYELN